VDGKLVAMNEEGRSNFNLLQNFKSADTMISSDGKFESGMYKVPEHYDYRTTGYESYEFTFMPRLTTPERSNYQLCA
jgi:hypothetical protein